jgi:predicted nuclease of predicted toxin-antitoxin system
VKVLLDACVWGGAKEPLVKAGHDVVWAGDWTADPGDEEILELARRDDRVLVTLDKDFGELAIVHGRPHTGILRLVGAAAREQAAVCLRILTSHGAELAAGALLTAEPGRLRIRQPGSTEEPA